MIFEEDAEEIRGCIRFNYRPPPGAPNMFALLSRGEREDLATFVKQMVRQSGPIRVRTLPEEFSDIQEMRIIEVSRPLSLRRDDPESFERLPGFLDELDADAGRVRMDILKRTRDAQDELHPPPADIYG